MIAPDHEDAQQAGWAPARNLGSVPTPPNRDQTSQRHAGAIAMLESKAGVDFHHAYLGYEVKCDRAVIDVVKNRLLAAPKDPGLRAFLEWLLPAFEQHVAHTEMLANKLGANVSM